MSVRRAVLSALIVLAVGGAVLAALGDFSDVPEAELRFSPGWALVALGGFATAELVGALLWRLVLRRMGAEIAPLPALNAWSVSSLGRYLPPGLLMPALRVARAAGYGVPARVCLASMAYEGAFSVIGAVIVASALLADLDDATPAIAGVVAAAILLVAVHPLVFERLFNAALRGLRRPDLPAVLSPRALAELTLGYAASFVLLGLSVFCALAAVHPVDASDLPAAVGSFGVGFVASLVAFFVPGGIGVREAGLAGALSLAVPFEVAVSVSVGVRLVQIALELLIAGSSSVLARRIAKPTQSTETSRRLRATLSGRKN